MTDLNKKQSFWAEQLPLFKKNYICLAQLEAVEFNNENGNFDVLDKDATGFDREDILEAYHSVNTGWAMWLKAKSQEKAKAQAVPEGYVLLPRVPTEKMLQAYERYSVAPMSTLSKNGYKAMVEAASESGAEK
ncbi:hypothetical protein ACJBLD_19470 [Acinetobacter nosocomialis]|uniref:hypothetical protein n=1 Tax=Acinetobacter nosocomialis TaxID=106654 RepID=UPI003862AC2C